MKDIKATEIVNEDEVITENILRPKEIGLFVGQKKTVENLKIFIEAAKMRGEHLDHVLFYGPPGLGKTTLANIISNEINCGIRTTSGPMLVKTGDIAAILTNLQQGDVLFIDEIHRLPVTVEELLYSAMEDFRLDIIIGQGPSARTIKIDINKFTLIGATTRLGLISNPLKDRFGIVLQLEFYHENELAIIVERCANKLNSNITQEGSLAVAQMSRGTPRIAIRLTKRVIDINQYLGHKIIDKKLVLEALQRLDINKFGLDKLDTKYINFILNNYKGGPVGIETIAAGLSEDRGTLEDTVEPFLIQIGFLDRTARGRILTEKCLQNF